MTLWRSCWFLKLQLLGKEFSHLIQRPCGGFAGYSELVFNRLKDENIFEVGFSKIINYFQIISLTVGSKIIMQAGDGKLNIKFQGPYDINQKILTKKYYFQNFS